MSTSESVKSVFTTFTNFAVSTANQTKKAAGFGLTTSVNTFHSAADKVGLRDKVDGVERAVGWAANKANTGVGRKLFDANRALRKASRMAKKTLDFEDVDGEMVNVADYNLLLSAAGAIEKSIAINRSHKQVFSIPANNIFIWRARVKKFDVGFAVTEIVKEGETPVDIEPMAKYRFESQIQGKLAACNHARNIVLVFDNSYSHLQAKKIVYWVAIGENVSLEDDTVGAARSKEFMAAEEGPMELM